MHDIDHTDPKWTEGRDYQLVCGLDTPLNLTSRERSLNISKNNRFLPWRVCSDEIGSEPVEKGDLCLFLDPDTSEWVLEKFLGTWWFEKSKRFCAACNSSLQFSERQKKLWADSVYKKNQSISLKGKAGAKPGISKGPRPDVSERNKELAKSGERTKSMKRFHERKKLSRMSKTDPLCPDF
jgi:hypothetical protein